jgi:hypothetical protein
MNSIKNMVNNGKNLVNFLKLFTKPPKWDSVKNAHVLDFKVNIIK